MVHHIVMWKFKPEIEEARKPELKKAMKKNLEGLAGKVPGFSQQNLSSNRWILVHMISH